MHNLLFCTACICTIALACFGYRFDSAFEIGITFVAVCLIGVPHGGLDHKTGRKLLVATWGAFWVLPFFGVYLMIAAITVLGWIVSPLVTALSFFVVSASHFGHEDQLTEVRPTTWRVLCDAAAGGLLIWIPAIARPGEMREILDSIIPGSITTAGSSIVTATQFLALAFLPLVMVRILFLMCSRTTRNRAGIVYAIRQMVLIGLFALTPILIAFAIYFCGWHSVRGLNTLMRENEMSLGELSRATLPMSVGAVVLTGLGMWFWNSGRELGPELTRTLFLGLSAMAVPHLALHAIPKRWFNGSVQAASHVRGAL